MAAGKSGVALYDCQADDTEELSFRAGQRLVNGTCSAKLGGLARD